MKCWHWQWGSQPTYLTKCFRYHHCHHHHHYHHIYHHYDHQPQIKCAPTSQSWQESGSRLLCETRVRDLLSPKFNCLSFSSIYGCNCEHHNLEVLEDHVMVVASMIRFRLPYRLTLRFWPIHTASLKLQATQHMPPATWQTMPPYYDLPYTTSFSPPGACTYQVAGLNIVKYTWEHIVKWDWKRLPSWECTWESRDN